MEFVPAITETCPRDGAVLLWDMAGTLVPFHPVTGVPGPMPGSDDFLPELNQDFRMVVTTGDEKDSARHLLAGFGLASFFEKIFGDLYTPFGKPYGEILRSLGASPGCSLAIGDRLRSDVASDTPDVVSILINQDGDTINAGVVAMVIRILRKKGVSYPEAFDQICAESAPDESLLGPVFGGEITQGWICNKGVYFRLAKFTHPILDGDRKIIVL